MEFFKKAMEFLSSLLIPEDKEIETLLNYSSSELKEKLPKAEPVSDRLTSPIFNYRNKRVKNIIWTIKYKGNNRAASKMAEILYEEIMSLAEERSIFDESKILLVPIPMTNERLREKGFNQCEMLCEEVTKINNKIKILNILEKTKDTGHQTKLDRRERLQNMKNSMQANTSINPESNSLLIIIDDVYTTGATINEARHALSKIGFKDILAITLTH